MASTGQTQRQLRAALLEAFETLLSDTAIANVQGFVEGELRGKRVAPQRRQAYLDGLSISYDSGSGNFVVNFTSSAAKDVENGVPAVDLKQAFARSPKRKPTTSSALGVSDWYFDVPFHFASSKEAEAQRSGVLQLGKPAELNVRRKSGATDAQSRIKVISDITEAAMLSMPEALKLGARAKTATKKRPATPGTEEKLYPRHVAGLLSGVQMAPKSSTMLQGASGPGSHALSFTTFRRVSAASDPAAWWIPAQPGVQLATRIEHKLREEMNVLIDSVNDAMR